MGSSRLHVLDIGILRFILGLNISNATLNIGMTWILIIFQINDDNVRPNILDMTNDFFQIIVQHSFVSTSEPASILPVSLRISTWKSKDWSWYVGIFFS